MTTKDTILTLGKLIDETQGRDAVHIAVAPVVSGNDFPMFPGQRIGLKKDSATEVVANESDPIGIVDPFLQMRVYPGDHFWMFLLPATITSLRHEWTHPAFPEVEAVTVDMTEKDDSEQWIRAFAKRSDAPGYEWLMAEAAAIADGHGDGSDYLHVDGMDAHGEIPFEFWHHAEIVLGRRIKGNKPTFFSCSC